MIANASKNADGSLTDHGKLNYSGELKLQDIEDQRSESNKGFNISTSIGTSPKGQDQNSAKHPNGSTTLGLQSIGNAQDQLTKASMGQGTVKNAIDATNRDINNTQEITRDQVTGLLNGSVTVDHRLVTESGREQIIQEHKDTPENFRQSAENLAKALPEGEYKDKALQTLNNIQANLAKVPPEFKEVGGDLLEAYPEFIRQGGEPKEFEKLINDPETLIALKEVYALRGLTFTHSKICCLCSSESIFGLPER